ncbi:helix-turn-helix domain-containing protein [Maledivibacter halophilus]|uniref:Predicted transcriptional regulators n=1 Tax=Maledivibacter halophilus TaxID=36842 RepID=A0A1T5MHV4_9FIRM|nr:helix-turn-helix transcriptional regulator [Maledivibacter halophilus]SKC87821.1 Predicted transcriptional regulators [Maledivibacter halophilus]
MDNVKLGKRIREERLRLGLTQEDLAEYSNISLTYMGRVERGERNMTVKTLVNIANALGVTIDYLLDSVVNIKDDNLIKQWLQLTHNRSDKEKKMAIDVIKVMFGHLDS